MRLLRSEEIGVLVGLMLVCLALTFHPLSSKYFPTQSNLLQVARQASYYGIMAVGMVFVLSMGDVDLSVGSILTLVNIVTAIALRAGVAIPIAVFIGIGTGAACGFLNGALSVMLRIPTIIVTLGTMSIFRGLALVWSNATPISQFPKDSAFFTVGGGEVLRVPTSALAMVIVGLLGYVLFTQTPFGWRVQAIGSNPQAAKFSGIPIARYRIMVMTLMGVISAVAGIMALAFLQSADPTNGPGFELLVIASAIIGGTPLSGGAGTIFGAIMGALLISVIRNGLVLLQVPTYWSDAVTGMVIIMAVAVGVLVKRKS